MMIIVIVDDYDVGKGDVEMEGMVVFDLIFFFVDIMGMDSYSIEFI